MSKSVLLALTLPLGFLAGCAAETTYENVEFPILALGQTSLEFGEVDWRGSVERTVLLTNDGDLPMGIASIGLGDDPAGTGPFTVAWDPETVECPEAPAEAKGIDVDTGGHYETGGGDTAGGGLVGDAILALGPGCQLPIVVTFSPVGAGDAYDALVVTTIGTHITVEKDGDDIPAYFADPIHASRSVYLHGESEYVQGTVVVRPRSFDFGYVHPNAAAEESPARIKITNVGDGDVTVLGAALADTCSPAYTLSHFAGEIALEGDQSTLAEVTYTPTDTRSARCELFVYTTDPANPEISVSIVGNSGSDLLNATPTVVIRSPQNGYRYTTDRSLVLELNVDDYDQPANTLDCRVKSGILLLETLASCTPPDESGHVYVEIAPEDLMAGTDTLVVEVTDGSMEVASATVSLLINAEYPADDDDGDGFSISGEPADCDDANVLTYPQAAEVFDEQDNNCDGTIDEGTEGADDDGDLYAEIDGDCNDKLVSVYPGATELDDGLDNDCDGTIDEATTASDEDGDGYTENDYDCDDDDASVHPGATELCDSVDNDCDGLLDSRDGCISDAAPPIVAGNLLEVEQTVCLEGEVLAMSALVHDPDRDAIAYQWQASEGTFDTITGAKVNFTCPEIAGDDAGASKSVNIYLLALDSDTEQDYAQQAIMVYDANTELYAPYSQTVMRSGSCSGGGSTAGALLFASGLLGLAARRRR